MSAEPQAGGSGRSAQTPRPDPSLTVPEGLVGVDKPKGWTSHDVVGRLRRLCGTRKVGHAGTLDPMATGVLIVGVGRGTKLLTHLVGADKTYEATIRLGATTVTEDAEGELTGTADPSAVGSRANTGVPRSRRTGSVRRENDQRCCAARRESARPNTLVLGWICAYQLPP